MIKVAMLVGAVGVEAASIVSEAARIRGSGAPRLEEVGGLALDG